MSEVITRAVNLLFFLLLIACVVGSYRVFEKLPDKSTDKSWIALTLVTMCVVIVVMFFRVIL